MTATNPINPTEDILFSSLDYKGLDIVLHDLPVYVVGNGPKCIIFAYDIHGTYGGRTRYICDYIASQGYTVYLPDFFRNTSWPLNEPYNEDFYFWIKLHNKYNIHEDIFDKVVPYAETHGAKSFAIIGVQWGGYVVFNVCKDKKFKCGVSIDPIVNLGVEFRQQEIELYQKVNCPQMIIVSEDNHIVDKFHGEMVEILKEHLGKDFKVERVPDSKYGYFSAQNIQNELNRKIIKQTIDKAIDFASNYLI